MEGHIRVLHAPDVPPLHTVLKGVRQHGQLPHHRLIRCVGTEGGGLSFNGGAHLVKIDHVQQVQIQHEAAVLPRVGHHKANFCQSGDGLGHRCAGNAQGGGQLIHIQLGPRRNAQADDIIIEHIRHNIPQLTVRILIHILPERVLFHC